MGLEQEAREYTKTEFQDIKYEKILATLRAAEKLIRADDRSRSINRFYTLGPRENVVLLPTKNGELIKVTLAEVGVGHYSYLVQTWSKPDESMHMHLTNAIEERIEKHTNVGKGLYHTPGVTSEWLENVESYLTKALNETRQTA